MGEYTGVLDDEVTSAKILDDEIVNADINSAAAIAYSKLATDPRICRIKTGAYTGDGSRSQAITGVGFQPKMVMIIEDATDGDNDLAIFTKIDQLTGEGAWLQDTAARFRADRLVSLDADGFTVDDEGIDADPNKNGEDYTYVAFG